MKGKLINVLSISFCLFLAACGGSKQSESSIQNSKSDGIIGGQLVQSADPIASSTVQIFTFQVGKNNAGQDVVTGLASCTGSIIDQDIILSAAHCTTSNPSLMFIYFSNDIPKDFSAFFKDMKNQPNLRRVIGGMVGANWKSAYQNDSNWDDISLLKFSGGIPDGFKVAKLITNNQRVNSGDTVTIAGYGLTDGVKKVQSTGLRKVSLQIANVNYSADEIMLDTTHGRSSCHGDSGGPAFVSVDNENYVFGLTSRADYKTDPRGECVGLTVYTNVQHFLGWIQSSIQTLHDPNYKMQPLPQPSEN